MKQHVKPSTHYYQRQSRSAPGKSTKRHRPFWDNLALLNYTARWNESETEESEAEEEEVCQSEEDSDMEPPPSKKRRMTTTDIKHTDVAPFSSAYSTRGNSS